MFWNRTPETTEETCLGFECADFLGSPETVRKNMAQTFSAPLSFVPGKYFLTGTWELRDGYAVNITPGATLSYFVLASGASLEADGDGVIEVSLDGRVLGNVHVAGEKTYDLFEGAFGRHELLLTFPTAGMKCFVLKFR